MTPGEVLLLLVMLLIVFGSRPRRGLEPAWHLAWQQFWSLLGSGLLTGAVFLLGCRLGLDLGRPELWRNVAALTDYAAGLGLVCVASSIYCKVGPERGEGRKLASLLAAFLAAGTITGVAARVLGPIARG